VITGPRVDSVEPVFEHARALLDDARVSRAAIHLDDAVIEYTAPDALLRSARRADLLLVDEAAAIPTPVLERLLERYPRIAFATTIHGYEGTGRGFAVRFQQILDRRSRGWRALRLEAPIRWAADDPVERLVFRLLALDSEPAPDEIATEAAVGSCVVEPLDRDALARDETLLSEIFGLLVLAHYRTRPRDLWRLLDEPRLQIFAARHAGHVVATAVLSTEGGFDPATATAIRDGQRRPQGHMLAEALAAHLGLERAGTLQGARVMRIAVHPAATRRGIGTRLIEALRQAAGAQGLDYLGASFGADPGLLEFWQGCGLQPVRLSVNRGASSGAHSALVLQGLSPDGIALAREARGRMLRQLPDQLTGPLRRVEPALVARMLRGDIDGLAYRPDDQDRLEVAAFVEGRRSFEDVIGALRRETLRALCEPNIAHRLSPIERDALVVAIAQQRGWTEVATELGLPGRGQAIALLRDALRALLGPRHDPAD
jgi:tRNA(Met) cytidine acetyltransferase